MNLQTRKLNLIQYLIGLQDENVFDKIEATIEESKGEMEQIFKPFTEDQLIERAEISNGDYSKGKFKTQEQLLNESKNW